MNAGTTSWLATPVGPKKILKYSTITKKGTAIGSKKNTRMVFLPLSLGWFTRRASPIPANIAVNVEPTPQINDHDSVFKKYLPS